MHSSTSSSNGAVPRAAIVWLLLLLLAAYIGMEALTRVALIKSSRILARTDRELKEASALRRSSTGGQKKVLIVGNSLLDEDVDFPQLQAGAATLGWEAHRLVVEQTNYLDWYFGVRRLTQNGCDPDAIVLMLTPEQLISNNVLDPIFATYLMRSQDLPEVVHATGIHPTDASGFLLARYSKFYGLRQELRKNLLRLTIPGMTQLTQLLIPVIPFGGTTQNVEPLVEKRIHDQQVEVQGKGIHFALVIPPVFTARPLEAAAVKGAARSGVPVIFPQRSGELPEEAFRDAFHMTPKEAKKYTALLAPGLFEWLKSIP